MDNFAKARAIAAQLKDGASPRRVRAVDNIVVACQGLMAAGAKLGATPVANKISELGLAGGPKQQSIYNSKELKTLIAAFADETPQDKTSRGANASYSSDEEELMKTLVTPRLKSMFRDILAERDKASAQMRLLDAFVTKLKKSNGALDDMKGTAAATLEHDSEEDAAIVRKFLEVLFNYGFDLKDGEIVKGDKPTGSRKFVEVLQKRGLLG